MGISVEKIKNAIGVFFAVINWLTIGLSALGGILGGPAVIIYQCFLWLQEGSWKSFHLIDVAKDYISNDILIWMQTPSSWVGISKILSHIVYDAPLSAVLIFVGVGLLLISGEISDSIESSFYSKH